MNEKLANIQWGEYRIGDWFDKLDLKFKNKNFDKSRDISRCKTKEYNLPLVNAKHGNNGIMYYGRNKDFDSATMTIDIVNDGAVSTGDVYPQPQETGVLYNAYLIKPRFKVTVHNLYFFSAAIQKSIKLKFGYENKAGWEKVKNEYIQLPTKNGEIDFEFIELFAAEIEAQRVAELKAYLLATGLKDYELTDKEKQAIDEIDKIQWKEFDLIDVFNVKNTKNILSSQVEFNSGNTPYLCASAENNGVASYITFNDVYIDKGNCIFIGGKTFVVSYQKKDFYSNDSHNLALYLICEDMITEKNQLYMATCIKKGLGHKYSWGNSISKSKIQTDTIMLPVHDKHVDYVYMETLISAVQKLVIKDVVLYADSKIEATR